MDFFKFTNPSSATRMEQGALIEELESAMWIERYSDPGEFKFVGFEKTGIRTFLPRGSFVSHLGSQEIMIVENHEISDDAGKESTVTVTGRSFESYLENRIVGSNRSFPTTGAVPDYVSPVGFTWTQAVNLIKNHILAANVVNAGDAVPYFEVQTNATGSGTSEERIVKRGDLYSRVIEILGVDNLGIKTIRPGSWSPAVTGINSVIQIHKGVDKTSTIVFSYDRGEIVSADYLWSIKKHKNCALVVGRWVDTMVTLGSFTEYNKRCMYVEASDIDQAQSIAPTGLARTYIVAAMQARGKEALAAQKEVALVKADVTREATSAIFRKDYNVGDLITVDGDYNETSTMRISEYVEIEDENGTSGYPTLTTP